MKKLIITTGSMTYAIKAYRILVRSSIPSKLIKITHSKGNGCTHGIEIGYGYFLDAVARLRAAGIEYKVISK